MEPARPVVSDRGADNDRVWGRGRWRYCDCAMADTGQVVAHSLAFPCQGTTPPDRVAT